MSRVSRKVTSLGLGKYEAAFGENDIGETVLPNLRACGASFVDPKRQEWRTSPRRVEFMEAAVKDSLGIEVESLRGCPDARSIADNNRSVDEGRANQGIVSLGGTRRAPQGSGRAVVS
jgi:hypothetical protein